MDDLLDDPESSTVISSLTVVETASALRRKHNRGEIPIDTVNALLAAFFDEALAGFLVLPMSEALFEHAFSLVLEDDLWTLDSLQLPTALVLAESSEWSSSVPTGRSVRSQTLADSNRSI
ncbi:type II toxin-antitoxin system VapC family toxin [Natronorarus salvus]|uniref:type II toxin-antitoxin system VapC family toxin n=1 Tax=Natronorarus salvus TaxID=3117733 RepID=UPI002F26C371